MNELNRLLNCLIFYSNNFRVLHWNMAGKDFDADHILADDYRKMLEPDWDVEAYMEEAKKYKHISIKDYPKYFAKEMKQYEKDFISRVHKGI